MMYTKGNPQVHCCSMLLSIGQMPGNYSTNTVKAQDK